MQFTPKTEEQIAAENTYEPLPAGTYGFEVVTAEDKLSSKGNEMIELDLKVFDNNSDKVAKVRDWLVAAMMFKIKHICDATGLTKQYEAGQLTSDMLVGRSGKVHLVIDTYEKDGETRRTNKVKDYVAGEKFVGGEDIPF